MKINLIIPSFYPAVIYGGPIFSTLHTCQELAKLNNIEVYASTTNANMTTRLDVKVNKWNKFEENFYVKYYNETIVNKISLTLFFNIWRDIKEADIVHVQSIFSAPTIISLIFANFFYKPILLSPRGSLGGWCIDNGSKFKNMWLNYLIKPFVKNIVWHATAQQEKDEILSIFPHAKVSIIPNGIEYELFQKSNILNKDEYLKKYTNQELSAEKVIISMGRLQKKKGFDILIDSFSKVLEKYSTAKLLIAGDDEGELEALEKQIKDLNLKNKVFFIGAISGQDKIDFLANADLFVLPSHNENFGNVYIESLAAGTPIVASHDTPWSEVESADCGKWVNNSSEDTTQAMIEMLQKDRDQMRVNSKKYAKNYGWEHIALQFKELFVNMVTNK
jgi:glycosyltransferase involved in cell wall biosynthesis